ncbi:hypothetical protein TREES_T100016168 [Tupaia chinensis]|uniref:Uncharacterized protein n=1 Tax=Tupaia chinensis TaxID=246437 RepID=L9JNT2_TUPCH|nr:hypothetical protein TREES_T100016168 [Tupaia chinensis]
MAFPLNYRTARFAFCPALDYRCAFIKNARSIPYGLAMGPAGEQSLHFNPGREQVRCTAEMKMLRMQFMEETVTIMASVVFVWNSPGLTEVGAGGPVVGEMDLLQEDLISEFLFQLLVSTSEFEAKYDPKYSTQSKMEISDQEDNKMKQQANGSSRGWPPKAWQEGAGICQRRHEQEVGGVFWELECEELKQ